MYCKITCCQTSVVQQGVLKKYWLISGNDKTNKLFQFSLTHYAHLVSTELLNLNKVDKKYKRAFRSRFVVMLQVMNTTAAMIFCVCSHL